MESLGVVGAVALPTYGTVAEATPLRPDGNNVSRATLRRRVVWGAVMAAGLICLGLVGLRGGGLSVGTAATKVPMVLQAALQQHGQKGWQFVGRADPNEFIKLNLMMKMSNEDMLEELAMAVSDPEHEEYGNHRSVDELSELIRPPRENVELVEKWLADAGVPRSLHNHSKSGDIVSVTLPIAMAEKILGAQYGMYRLEGANKTIIRAEKYSLPEDVGAVVDWVGPTVEFPMVRSIHSVGSAKAAPATDGVAPRRASEQTHQTHQQKKHRLSKVQATANKQEQQLVRRLKAEISDKRRLDEQIATAAGFKTLAEKSASVAGGLVDPGRLKGWYDVDKNFIGTQKNNIQAVVGFLGEHSITQGDMQGFYKRYAKEGMTEPVEDRMPRVMVESKKGGFSGIESTLDLEYIMSMAVGVPTQFYYYDGRSKNADGDAENEPFLEWLQQIGSMSNHEIPLVFSISYADWEVSVPKAYATRVNKALMVLAARGVSVIVASGDGGVEGAGPLPHSAWQHTCRKGDRLIPTFPASSPWVTSVGAVSGFPEVGAKLSAGGFSDYFDRPSYQKSDVDLYLSHCDPTQFDDLPEDQKSRMVKTLQERCKGGNRAKFNPPLPAMDTFNKLGRGIPDVSMQGRNFMVLYGSSWTHVDGTSASTPTFAAMISGVNEYRLRAGKPRLGFLNPALYNHKVRGAFNDVDSGTNPGCGIEGFYASTGWDPVTGLGTPNFERLKQALMGVSGGRRASESEAQKPKHGQHY